MDRSAIDFLRMQRQHFLKKADAQEYETLFRDSSPVLPLYWCRPGSPPQIPFRAAFDDETQNFALRSRRELVKGRFQGGSVAYVYAKDLELFACAYRKETPPTFAELQMLELLEQEGPLTVRLIKEFTGKLVKEITPVLHKLQEKFLVFEDQTDNEWDRAWYVFSAEFPSVRLDRYPRREAMEKILLRFTRLNVCFSLEMAKAFYRFPAKNLSAALESLCKEGFLTHTEGLYVRTEDLPLLMEPRPVPPSIFPLQRNDFFVKSQEPYLKGRYGSKKWDVLQYLLIDGTVQGALTGKFHMGPFEVENVELKPGVDWTPRREEILQAARQAIDPDVSPVRRFQGIPL